ncbi:MAG: ParB/RepB/Spo0J family partition protein [Burkholderiales bacterium]|nr:ParB/RepB/Spo0J family partition protein [Burkholderiales bacterium]
MSTTSKNGRHAKGKAAAKSGKGKVAALVAGAASVKAEPVAAQAPVQSIPLEMLTRSEKNARKTNKAVGIESLAASIAGIGLIENLAVIPAGKAGLFEVVAGDRRLQALWSLRDSGRIAGDYPVDCRVYASEAAVAVSLSENAQREPMHPADACEAFQTMMNEGASIAGIAVTFGVSEHTVRQHLKLANVAPALVKAFRAGDVTLEQMMALAITDDHKRQMRVWKNSEQEWQRRPSELRKQLTTGEVNGTAPIARFVGADAYRAAGGFVREDLFAAGDEGRYFADGELLESLAMAKLTEERAGVEGEGWAWIEVRTSIKNRYHFEQCRGTARKATPQEAEQEKALREELALLQDKDDDLSDEDDERIDEIREELDALRAKRERYSKDVKAIAGTIITIEANGARRGSLLVLRGLIRPEDRKAVEKARKTAAKEKAKKAAGGEQGEQEPKAELSDALIHALTTERTMALRASLLDAPMIALRAVVHAIVAGTLYDEGSGADGVALRTGGESVRLSPEAAERCAKAHERIEDATNAARSRLPEKSDALWAHLMELEVDALLGLLAVAMAPLIDGSRYGKNCPTKIVADGIAKAVGLDMTAWWTASAENYLGRVNKTLIVDAVTEACGAETAKRLAPLRKGDAVKAAEKELEGKNWLPALLRVG